MINLPEGWRVNRYIQANQTRHAFVVTRDWTGDNNSISQVTVGWWASQNEAAQQTELYVALFGDALFDVLDDLQTAYIKIDRLEFYPPFLADGGFDHTAKFTPTENEMNVLKQTDKLFPHLKGEMLADPTRMVLNGFVREVVAQDGNSSRLEIGFEGSKKTAVVNAAQVLKLVSMFGAETEEWKGQAVVLYAERGSAFGSTYCAIRIADMNDSKEAGQYRRYLTAKAKAKPAPAPSPEPEPDTIDFETGELIPTPAPTANAFSTQ
jgi:hypothetical protein